MSTWDDSEHPAMQEVRDLKKALAAERERGEKINRRDAEKIIELHNALDAAREEYTAVKTLLAAERERCEVEIRRLRERLGPHEMEVVLIAGAGHYVNKRVKAEIEQLRTDIAAERERSRLRSNRLREAIIRAKDALLDGQSTQWVHDLLVDAIIREGE